MTKEERAIKYAANRLARFAFSSKEVRLKASRESRGYWRKPHPFYYYWDGIVKALETDFNECAKSIYDEMMRHGGRRKMAHIAEAITEAIEEYDAEYESEPES